jgi:hypothetical protein
VGEGGSIQDPKSPAGYTNQTNKSFLSSKVKVAEILSPPDKQQTRNNTQLDDYVALKSPKGHYELVNKSHHQKVVCTPNNKRAGQKKTKKTRRLWENV